jgi:predicted MFS family arabinose efflux permease
MVLAALITFGRFEGSVPQRKSLIVRQRYWLYYAIVFMSGARRQIFIAFGGFLLVKKFGYSLADMAMLMLVTSALTTMLAPQLGRLVGGIGERQTMIAENIVLVVVFSGYATTASAFVAAALFVVDGVFFTLTIAQRTYFQKIADPGDMAATASVSFTINHVAAVVIPVTFGLLGMGNPSIIFWLGVLIAVLSLGLAMLVPRHPEPGRETALAVAAPRPV